MERSLNEKHGLELGGHYVTVYQGISKTLTGEDKAWSGLARLTGSWTLIGRGTETPGRLAFTVDHRHAFTDVATTDLGGQAGYLGQTQVLMSDADAVVVNLNWSQGFNDGSTGLLVGRFDPSDYMNVLGYANPWTTFANLAVLLDASVAFPDASWGIGGGTWFGDDQWYVLGTINDANGLVTDNLEFFSGGSEFFTQGEIGWSPTKDDRYTKNVNLTYWHVDERNEADIDSGEGLLFSANWTFDNKWMPFFRAGFSEGDAALYNESATVGFIRSFRNVSDLLGLGVNWGDPSDDSLRQQLTTEVFYRVQFSQNLAFTPSFQWLTNPALNPEENRLWVLGFRLRVTY